MHFKSEFVSIELDFDNYKKAIFNSLTHINERAGRAWINAAIKETPIPAWSGASRATFSRLAQSLGTSVPISIAAGAPNRVGLGKSASTGSKIVKDKNIPYVGFIYSTTLRYLHYNEYNKAVAGKPPQPYSNNVRFTPYFFQQRAETAWSKIAEQAKLPDPMKYINRRKI